MMFLKFKYINVLAFLILNQHALSSSARLNIKRGDQDVFENPNCPIGVGCNCNSADSCVDSKCKRCKCSATYKTFLSSNDNNGQCVKDRRLLFIPITAFPNSFSVQNINKMCMQPKWNNNDNTYRVIKIRCNEADSWQRWIWTRYNQLMHVETLKCLQEGPSYTLLRGRHYFNQLVLGECKKTEIKQLWQCLGKNNVNFQLKNSLYMYQYSGWDNIYGIDNDYYSENIKWKRYPSNAENVCSKAFGCYEFKDSSGILVTEMKKCNQQCSEESEISVPHKSGGNLCFIMWEKLQYLDNDEWKQLLFRDEIFTIDKRHTTFLKWNFTKATNDWNGLIVKLNFYCANGKLTQVNNKDTKCVVIKFKGNFTYPPTVPPTVSTTPKLATTLNAKLDSGTSTIDTTTEASKTSTATDTMSNATTGAAKKYKSDSPPLVIIIVVLSVMIAILILCGILGFIFYKRRRRSECKTRTHNADISSRDARTEPDYTIPYVKTTELPGQRGASTVVTDEGGYVIPLAELNTETSTAIPKRDKDIEDELGYVIPNTNEMTPPDQNVSSDTVPHALNGGEGDYEPLKERYDHVYQRLLPSTSQNMLSQNM